MASVGQKMEVDVRPGDLADDERTEAESVDKIKTGNVDNQTCQRNKSVDIEGDQAANGDAEPDDDAMRKNKKHRRGKNKGGKRHWKPYNKLSWEERKALEERESRRAQRKRQQRFANGQPMAPYNTTQFLMEQHQADDPDYNIEDSLRPRNDGDAVNGSGSVDSSEEYIDSPEDDDLFMAKDFSETYDTVHAERLQNMTKEELVRELIELESRVERLEKKESDNVMESVANNVASVANNVAHSVRNSTTKVDITSETSLHDELTRLKQENEKLRQENAKLRSAAEGGRSPSA